MAIDRTTKHNGRWWDRKLVSSITLNCGSGWCSSFCYVNSGWARVEVCWILYLATSDIDSHKECFRLFGEVQAQAGNLCVDHEVHEGTLKYIGKKHYTLWNHEGTLKYIGKKHYSLWNIHKYRDSRKNTYPNHTLKYIPLSYHQVSSSRLSLYFLVSEPFEIRSG